MISQILNTFSSSKASSLTAGLIGTEPTTKLIVGVLHRVLSPAGEEGRLLSGCRWRGSAENERSAGWSAFSAADLFSSSEFRSQKKFNYHFHQTVHNQLTIDSLRPSSNVGLSMYLIEGIRFGTWKDRRLNWALKAKESLLRLSRNVTIPMKFLRCEEVTLHGRFKLSFGYILMVSLKVVKLCVFLKENPFSWILLVNNKSSLVTSLQNSKDDGEGIPWVINVFLKRHRFWGF